MYRLDTYDNMTQRSVNHWTPTRWQTMLDDMPPKKETAATSLPPMVRLPEATRERLARVSEAMSKRALTELPASVVVRAVLDRGLDALEGELGIGKGKR